MVPPLFSGCMLQRTGRAIGLGCRLRSSVSCEFIWAWSCQQAWLVLCGHVEELGELSQGQGGCCLCTQAHVWVGVRVSVCLRAGLCSGWSKYIYTGMKVSVPAASAVELPPVGPRPGASVCAGVRVYTCGLAQLSILHEDKPKDLQGHPS